MKKTQLRNEKGQFKKASKNDDSKEPGSSGSIEEKSK